MLAWWHIDHSVVSKHQRLLTRPQKLRKVPDKGIRDLQGVNPGDTVNTALVSHPVDSGPIEITQPLVIVVKETAQGVLVVVEVVGTEKLCAAQNRPSEVSTLEPPLGDHSAGHARAAGRFEEGGLWLPAHGADTLGVGLEMIDQLQGVRVAHLVAEQSVLSRKGARGDCCERRGCRRGKPRVDNLPSGLECSREIPGVPRMVPDELRTQAINHDKSALSASSRIARSRGDDRGNELSTDIGKAPLRGPVRR